MNPNTDIEDKIPVSTFMPNRFMIASLLCGICALLSILFVFPPFIFGGLSIIFAVLSRGSKMRYSGFSIGGIISSVTAMIITVVMSAFIYYLIFYVPEFRTTLNKQYEHMYGQSFDDILEEINQGTFDGLSIR